MNYTTIYTAYNDRQLAVIRPVFEEHKIDYRIFDEPMNDSIPEGKKVQVKDEQVEKAKGLLKENGLLDYPKPGPDAHMVSKFWLYLTIGLVLVIIISILINSL